MAEVQLTVDPRAVTGKKVRSLRRQGLTPAHLYGRGTDSLSLQADTTKIVQILKTTGRNAVIDLQVNGEGDPRAVMLRGVQRDPVTDELVHIDFFQISLTDTLRADVPVVLTGEAPAVQVFGGVLLHGLDYITVEALPHNIPEHFVVDISALEELEASIFVRDLDIPENVEVHTEPDVMLAKVGTPRLAAADEEEEAAAAAAAEEALAEGEEGAPPAEGEEGAAPSDDRGGDEKSQG